MAGNAIIGVLRAILGADTATTQQAQSTLSAALTAQGLQRINWDE